METECSSSTEVFESFDSNCTNGDCFDDAETASCVFDSEDIDDTDDDFLFTGSNCVHSESSNNTWLSDWSVALSLAKKVGWDPSLAPFCDDTEIMTEAVARSPLSLQFASPRLRGDKDVVLIAVRGNWSALGHAGFVPRADAEVVREAVKQSFLALQFASILLRSDLKFMSECVQIDGNGFEFASHDLRENRAFVLEAVQRCGVMLEHASELLRGDDEVVLQAVSQDWRALAFANGSHLFANEQIILHGLRQDVGAVHFADDRLRADRSFRMKAVRMQGKALLEAGDEGWFSDRAIVREAIKSDALVIKLLPPRLRKEFSLMVYKAKRFKSKFASCESIEEEVAEWS
jgi:hypothetical protein|eukprot:TRINITY_DN64842_c0_g1_i1.p1 TRINITY_DN64842_c0_g1~~TRINITY_DN64842_c0_g1_i1.p1  ORF type:complete len:374 (+),score=77.29 TRINITY_DN64842_c0_g1_i1:82-1122(+)